MSSEELCLRCQGSISIQLNGLWDTRFGIENEYSIGVCDVCRLEQLVPAPNQPELKRLYETFYNFGGCGESLYERLREQLFASPIYHLWAWIDGDISFHFKKGRGRLLDVGCNEGRGLERYRDNSFDAEGLELNDRAAEIARARGFIVHSDLDALQAGLPYDIVILSNVLEHSLDPVKMLLQINRVLRPGGQLWISCPNYRSWQRKLFGSRWINWHVPFHIVHLCEDTAAMLLKDAGFRQRSIRQESPALWAAYSLLAWLGARQGQRTSTLRNPFLVMAATAVIRGGLFPILWLANRLGGGDCLLITAEKS